MKPGIIAREKVSFNTARIKILGERFEIVVDPDKAIEFKEGKQLPIDEVCKAFQVFKDANKGIIANNEELQKAFHTTSFEEIAKKILSEGEIQLTTAYREHLREQRLKEIIDLIHRQAVDPRTKMPVPVQRLELAIKQAHVVVNEFKKAADQVQEVIKKLRPILPLSIETVKVQIIVTPEYSSKIYGWLKRFDVKQEQWLNNGGLQCIVELPAGLKSEFVDELNHKTHGSVEVKIL